MKLLGRYRFSVVKGRMTDQLQNLTSQVHVLLGRGQLQTRHRLTIKDRPADGVAQSLIIQNQVADRWRQLRAATGIPNDRRQ